MKTIIHLALLLMAVPGFGAMPPTDSAAPKPSLRPAIDPRIELISLVFRLAGNPEYNQARVPSYQEDVDNQFNQFADHPCVKMASRLRNSQGVSYDACMSLAVLLTDAYDPALKVSLEPWPDFLDRRWTAETATNFVVSLRQFVHDTAFRRFIENHAELYQATQSRLQTLLDAQAHLEWFQSFFGERPQAKFTVIPALLNGGACYGPHSRDAGGREELFCILGVWETDGNGLPSFRRNMLSTVVHEFCHSYANAIVDKHAEELQPSGDKLFRAVAEKMRRQAYGDAQTMLRESLVRACVTRYVRQYDGPEAMRQAVAQEQAKGFRWMAGLCDLLAEYEGQRDRYSTLEAFAPRLVAFFNEYVTTFERDQAKLAASQPMVVSMIPSTAATWWIRD
jgi:hypothetical protein